MHPTGTDLNATASIQIGKRDGHGNWPMIVEVSGLRTLPAGAYYVLWLTKHGKPVAPCGWFRANAGITYVQLTVPYKLERFDGWVVTAQNPGDGKPGPVLLTT